MSEVQSRPAASRGRGSARGGRGTFRPSRGGAARNAGHSNGDTHDNIDDQSELGQLKKRYGNKLATLAEMFTELSAEEILLELKENSGDLETTAAKISEGSTAKWGEVRKKNKDRSRSKIKEPATSASNNDSFQSPRPARSGKTSFDGSRDGRGRGGFENRGGRGGRGGRGRGGAANGVSRGQAKDRSNDVPPAWGETTTTSNVDDPWGTPAKVDGDLWETPEAVEKPVAVKPVATPVVRGSWASLLKPAVPPAPVQSKAAPQQAAQPTLESASSAAQEAEPVAEAPDEPEPVAETEELAASAQPEVTVTEQSDAEPAAEGPLEELTEETVERIEDVAPPAPAETAASASALQDNASTSPAVQVAIPQNATKHTPVPKGTPGRTFRRVLDQQEGVVMPGNHAEVNRTALQFGSMGLSGDLDDDDEAENSQPTAQPAQPSPIAQPVASLPPTGPSQFPLSQVPESIPTPRQAPGLSSQPQGIPQASVQPPLAPQSMTQHQVHPQLAAQYNRYGVPEQQQPQTKPFDSFGHMQQQSAHQQPPTQLQQPQAQHPQSQPQNYAQYMQPQQPPSHIGIGVSSAPEQQQQHYNYYTDRSQPPGFGLYGNSAYMQSQQAHAQQEAGASQQRASSGLSGAAEPSAQVPASVSGPGQVQQPTSRYGAPAGDHGSGHATPSPAPPASQPHQQTMGQQTYPMQFHPYYNQYMHQGFYSQPNPFTKNMYGYPQYMPSQQYPDHSSSPAGLGGFGAPSAQARDSMGGITDYNRMNTTAAQQSLPQHATTGSYGNGIPNFLNSRGLPQDQQQQLGAVQQQNAQQAQNDDLKFGENKPPTGPSAAPSLQGQPGRPGSATSGASGLVPQQAAQSPAGMYGSHLNPNLHGGHQGQQSGYGVGQGQSANHYSMYSGAYPSQYSQGSGRHAGAGAGAGWSYGH